MFRVVLYAAVLQPNLTAVILLCIESCRLGDFIGMSHTVIQILLLGKKPTLRGSGDPDKKEILCFG